VSFPNRFTGEESAIHEKADSSDLKVLGLTMGFGFVFRYNNSSVAVGHGLAAEVVHDLFS
jgi:hypothetical protein